jgi:hypothetical protein
MTASEEPAGLKQETMSLTLLEELVELRNAYILEMTPKAAGFESLCSVNFGESRHFCNVHVVCALRLVAKHMLSPAQGDIDS